MPKTKFHHHLEVLSENHSRVKQVALDILSSTKMPKTIGVGVELEFFLRDKNTKQFCTLERSQLFLRELSDLPGWSIFSKNNQSGRILRVSKEIDKIRYHSVKYEHPPHMMEIAVGYQDNLTSLKATLLDLHEELELVAKKVDLYIDISLRTEAPIISWSDVNQVETRFENLSQSRKKIFDGHASIVPDERIDFTTFIAATQYHFGGVRWWEEEKSFVERVYRAEFIISGIAYKKNKNLFNDRWNSYRYVFGEMSLLGFPLLDNWNFDSWVNGLLKSPYFKDNSLCFDDAVSQLNNEQLKSEVLNIRDLQIVKPKWIGTLEFRSDPAMDDINLMMQLAALRLGAYIAAQADHPMALCDNVGFKELSKLWWSGAHVTDFEHEANELKEICFDILKARGFGEERFL